MPTRRVTHAKPGAAPPGARSLLGARNIGATVAQKLAAVGVTSLRDLERLGPAAVYARLRAAFPQETLPVCYYLYSLQGALEGRHWDDIGEATKQSLRAAASLPPRRKRGA